MQSIKNSIKNFTRLSSGILLALTTNYALAATFGSALSFNGGDITAGGTYVSVPPLSGTANLPITLEAWAKPDGSQLTFASLIASRNGTGSATAILAFDGAKICYSWGTGGSNPPTIYSWYCTTSSPVVSGKWQHFAVVFKAGTPNNTANIYQDGVFVESFPLMYSTHVWTGDTLRLGNDSVSNTRTYKGLMDEARVWAADKTSDITSQNYRCSPSLSNTTGLLLRYNFDEGTGTTAANSSSSGSTNNGTLINSPSWVTSTILTEATSPCYNYVPPPTNAPIDLSFSKTPEIFATEIEAK